MKTQGISRNDQRGMGCATRAMGAGARLRVRRVENPPHMVIMVITGVNLMSNKMIRVLLLLAVVVGLAMPGMAADEKKYRFEFFGGVSYPMKKNFTVGYPQAEPAIEGKQDWSLGPRGGVRMGIEGARHWGQDYTFSYGTNSTDISASGSSFSFTNHFYEAYHQRSLLSQEFRGPQDELLPDRGAGRDVGKRQPGRSKRSHRPRRRGYW